MPSGLTGVATVQKIVQVILHKAEKQHRNRTHMSTSIPVMHSSCQRNSQGQQRAVERDHLVAGQDRQQQPGSDGGSMMIRDAQLQALVFQVATQKQSKCLMHQSNPCTVNCHPSCWQDSPSQAR
jgi:hypothetical protein